MGVAVPKAGISLRVLLHCIAFFSGLSILRIPEIFLAQGASFNFSLSVKTVSIKLV